MGFKEFFCFTLIGQTLRMNQLSIIGCESQGSLIICMRVLEPLPTISRPIEVYITTIKKNGWIIGVFLVSYDEICFCIFKSIIMKICQPTIVIVARTFRIILNGLIEIQYCFIKFFIFKVRQPQIVITWCFLSFSVDSRFKIFDGFLNVTKFSIADTSIKSTVINLLLIFTIGSKRGCKIFDGFTKLI